MKTIKEVLSMEKDEVIKNVSGGVTYIGKRASGIGQYGDWTLQSITLKDDTGEISVRLQNQPEFAYKVGDTIRISCYHSDKHGFVGVKRDIDKSGKDLISVSKTGIIDDTKEKVVPEEVKINAVKSKEEEIKAHIKAVMTPSESVVKPTPIVVNAVKPTNWEEKERRSIIGMCISYAKDLCIAGKIDKIQITSVAMDYVNIIYGEFSDVERADVVDVQDQEKIEKEHGVDAEEIPF